MVWVAKGKIKPPPLLDGRVVSNITSFLLVGQIEDNPTKLAANRKACVQGSITLGMGFTFDDQSSKESVSSLSTMHSLIQQRAENRERIFPYVGGDEINESPTHEPHRYVIDFAEMTLDEAQMWPELLAILERNVKPERLKKSAEVAKWPWWQHWRPRTHLYGTIRSKARVLVTNAQASTNHGLAFCKPNVVFANSLNVFTLDSWAAFTILQSYCHELWARFFSSTLGDALRYNPTDCFETFPFSINWEDNESLEVRGKTYYEFRANLMVRNNEGFTKTYNRFHDPEETSPDILRLRELHAEMDRAVLDAYGWTDIPTDCHFILDYEDDEEEEGGDKRKKKKPWRYRWPDDVRDEVLARLLELNKQRYEEEVRLGLHAKGKGKPAKTKKATNSDHAALDFGSEEES
jgi:hypothetical protein